MNSIDGDADFSSLSRNVCVDESYVAVPLSELDPNKHLYTCSRKPVIDPLVCTRTLDEKLPPEIGPQDEFSYAIRGVCDLSLKCDSDWIFRRFESPVSSFLFSSFSN